MGAMVIMMGGLVGYTAAVGGWEPGRNEAVFVGMAGRALCICVLGKNWTGNDNRCYPIANSHLQFSFFLPSPLCVLDYKVHVLVKASIIK